MKLFLDTANRDLIKKWVPTNLIDGVTTNPSLLSKEGKNIKDVLLDICKMVKGDVSIEVVKKEPSDVYKQAKEISKLAKNVVVKIPFQFEYLPVISKLVKENIKINVTLIFSVIQATLVAKLGVKYISPFIGRLDDIDIPGLEQLEKIMLIKNNYNYKSEIIAASIRNVMHMQEAILMGTDVVTIPPSLLDKIFTHPLTMQGIEKFDSDWKKLGKKELLK
ncbi:fructose-6-phosphate aldolase [Candidatus Dependentiae bacterium]|nr:fructose-6-phosphate aldolase [Candidatus Dependentiae bacterium]